MVLFFLCFGEYFWAHIHFTHVNQIPIALDMAKDSNGKDRELKKRIESDNYMSCAVRECYASFRNVIKFLVGGDREKKYVFFNLIILI